MKSTIIRLLAALSIAVASTAAASAATDADAIRKLMFGQFDRPEQRLSVDPIVVSGEHAVAGWVQGDMGGRALLRRKGHEWQIVLCAGDQIKTADALQKVGLPAGAARELATRLAAAEAKTAPARLAMFARFETILMLDGSGSHPPAHHGQGHGTQHGATHAQTHVAQHGAQHGGAHTTAAKTYKAGAIVIDAPWLRATPQGAQVAGGYMKITNTGHAADRLVGGTLERAERFEVHEMTMVDNVMRMRAMPNGIEIKPGDAVELKPGGYHIMGMALKDGYRQGQTIKGTLIFEKAGTVNIEYRVEAVGGSQHHGGH